MLDFLGGAAGSRGRRARRARRARPSVRPLEGRRLLSFAPAHPEFRVNAAALTEPRSTHPEVAMAANGDFAVVWENPLPSGNVDILLRRYAADGTPKTAGDEVVTASELVDLDPAIAMAPDGRFVVTWTRTNAAGNRDIVAARFAADSTNLGEFTVPTEGLETVEQRDSDVAISPDGSFAIAWTQVFSISDQDIRYRAYDADGVPVTGDLPVAATAAVEAEPAIARRPGPGRSGPIQVIAWASGDPGAADIAFRTYATPDAGGAIRTANAVATGDQFQADVALDAAGGFAIAWTDVTTTADYRIEFRRFAGADSQPTTPGDLVAVPGGTRPDSPRIAMANSGRFALAYEEGLDNTVRYLDVSPAGIISPGLPYDAASEAEFFPSVAISPSGTRMVVVADDNRTHFYDPYARVFQRAPTPADYDGDGRTDPAVYGYGRIAYRPTSGGVDVIVPFGGPADVPLVGDYDGDGRTDPAVYGYGRLAYRPSGGGADVLIPYGGPEDRAVAGDFDGDGRTDVAVYGYGRLAYFPSGTGGPDVSIPFGGPLDEAVAGDYDGDGRDDPAVYGYGRFAYRPSRGGVDVLTPFGGFEDTPRVGDFDGDGRADPAVYGYGRLAYRPSGGGLDVLVPFGGPADRVFQGDFDGDGRADPAVYGYGRLAYRPSSGGVDVLIPFGGPADVPLPVPPPPIPIPVDPQSVASIRRPRPVAGLGGRAEGRDASGNPI